MTQDFPLFHDKDDKLFRSGFFFDLCPEGSTVVHFGFWILAWNFFFVDIYVSVSGLGIFLSCRFLRFSFQTWAWNLFSFQFPDLEFLFCRIRVLKEVVGLRWIWILGMVNLNGFEGEGEGEGE
ncbi:hypothetical protein RhiirA4_431213, partial [Rhizophagus irregularis]